MITKANDNKNGVVRNLFGTMKNKAISEVNEALEQSDAK